MIRYVNAAHLHSHSPSCFLAGCRGSPPLPQSSSSFSSASLPSSSCAHLLERCCRCCLCVECVCSCPGLLSQVPLLLSLGLIESRDLSGWGNGCATWHNLQVQSRRLPRAAAAVRHMQMRRGFNYGPIPLDIL